MTTLLAQHFHDLRVERGLNLAQLAAALVGYANATKGMNRLVAFERNGQVHPDLLGKLSVVLGVSNEDRQHAGGRGRAAVPGRLEPSGATRPVEPYAVVRLMAGPVQEQSACLPEYRFDRRRPSAFAADLARHWHRKCLPLSSPEGTRCGSTRRAWCMTGPQAVPGEPNAPFMDAGSQPPFIPGPVAVGLKTSHRSVRWPEANLTVPG